MTEEMNPEDQVLETLDDEDEEDDISLPAGWRARQQKKRQMRNQQVIDQFLGKGGRTYSTGILPKYYGGLLIWALYQHITRKDWKIVDILGYTQLEPVYAEVNTGNEKLILPVDGQMLIEKGNDRVSITVDINPGWRGSVQLEGPAEKQSEISQFVTDVMSHCR